MEQELTEEADKGGRFVWNRSQFVSLFSPLTPVPTTFFELCRGHAHRHKHLRSSALISGSILFLSLGSTPRAAATGRFSFGPRQWRGLLRKTMRRVEHV